MTGRPLPLITLDNEFFWTSGADGKLRLQECGDCTALIHPPAPVCRYCRSHNLGVRAVSGRGTLAGFTVNHRFSVPGLAAPNFLCAKLIYKILSYRFGAEVRGK